MADEKFDLVFKGQLVKSVDEAQAKANLGRLFKIDGARLDALFTGKAVTLKKNLDFDTASKYRVAIKKAGAVVELVAVEAPAPVAKAAPVAAPAAPKPAFNSVPAEPKQSKPVAAPAAAIVGSAASQVSVPVPDFGVAPPGADILEGGERESLPLMEVDISGIALRETTGNLVDASEIARPAPVQVDIANIALAEQLGELLKPEERKKVEPVQVDISGISLGAEGERLSAPKAPEPPAPDISHIQLAD
ncbi:hypothetical protein KO528_13355 [Saccharophagus degradans]|uniref:hypothetical protein n=1 Tax=Saccharophagus degradans TaxID=86304 RepID=UPI001C09CCCE|nr:hypothetical protein [Saccharophagus degradans]MBU2986342.1 hypothetical protein [Saccharophagus degradans]